MDLQTALAFAAENRNAVLITIRRDGRPQSSDIAMSVRDGIIEISVTGDRAKTRNLARDNRAVVHVTNPGSWSYVSFDGTVELLPVTTSTDDATADALVGLYERIAGEAHPNWDEFRQAMVDEGRLVIRFSPVSVTGQVR
jgi:PPOX class probable F420-dependent enzyme